MLRKITINMSIMLLLALSSQSLMAQPGYEEVPGFHSKQLVTREPYYSPFIKLQRWIREAQLYEYLLDHPHFIKLQDMAQRVWEKQTGNKRRAVTWSRRNIISPNDLPVRSP